MSKHYVPEGYVHVVRNIPDVKNKRGYTKKYTKDENEELHKVSSTTRPFTFTRDDFMLWDVDMKDGNRHHRIDIDFFYKAKIQIKDVEKYGAFYQRVDVYHDSGTVESKDVESHIGVLISAALLTQLQEMHPDDVLKNYGHEINVLTDPNFMHIKNCEEECGIEIFEISFVIVDINDRDKEEEY